MGGVIRSFKKGIYEHNHLTSRRAKAKTHHSFGGTTFTIPARIPYLSILLIKDWKSRNWSIVWEDGFLVSGALLAAASLFEIRLICRSKQTFTNEEESANWDDLLA